MAWYKSINFTPMQVSRLTRRFELLTLCEEPTQAIIEDLPATLSYAISAKSAESTPAKAKAKEEVLAGEIDTGKAYRERIKELEGIAEAEHKERGRLEREIDMIHQANEGLAGLLKKKKEHEPEVITKTEYVEVPDAESRKKVERYEELFGDVSMYDGQVTRVTNGDAITYTVYEFTEATRGFMEKFGHLTHFAAEFGAMIPEGKQEYRAAINDIRRFLTVLERNMDEESATIIEAEATEVDAAPVEVYDPLLPEEEETIRIMDELTSEGNVVNTRDIEAKHTSVKLRAIQGHIKKDRVLSELIKLNIRNVGGRAAAFRKVDATTAG